MAPTDSTSGPGTGPGNDGLPDREAVARFFDDLARYTMPFGKYAGRKLYDLPHEYLLWFQQQGFPAGRLGELMREVCSIRSEGSEAVFEPIRHAAAARQPHTRNDRRG